MGQKRITIDITEGQAKILRWAVNRAHMTAPSAYRTKLFAQKLDELKRIVDTETEGLEEIPLPPLLTRIPPTRRY